MCSYIFSEDTPCGSILIIQWPPPVSDHSVFAFWVVADGTFDCISYNKLYKYEIFEFNNFISVAEHV